MRFLKREREVLESSRKRSREKKGRMEIGVGIHVWWRKNKRKKNVWMKERKNNTKNKKLQFRNATTIFS